jgi:hypothetical protein
MVSEMLPTQSSLGRQNVASALKIDDNYQTPHQGCMGNVPKLFHLEIVYHVNFFSKRFFH